MNKEAYLYSIKLLTKRDYSSYKISSKLLSKGYDELEIDEVVSFLQSKNYINDHSYSLNRAKTFIQKGLSNELITIKLSAEELYLNKEEINIARDELDYNENEQIQKLIEKKYKSLTKIISSDNTAKVRQRLLQYLAGKGYTYEEVSSFLPGELIENS